jgi:hypothetical protein
VARSGQRARPRRVPAGLAAALAVYVLLRAAILYTDFDRVGMTMFELYPMGTIPRILLEGGGPIPLGDYYDNAAGQLLTGLLAVPFYLALGPTYLALKLVPFALGAVALVAVFAFVRRFWGGRAATLSALLFAAGPATLVKYSLFASGNHFENLAFTMVAVAAFWRMHSLGVPRRWLWISGFAAGFALFVFLGALIPIALLALAHLGLRGWRRSIGDLAHAAPAFALGLLPLVLLNLGTDARGLGFLRDKFAGSGDGPDPASIVRRLGEFFFVHLPRSASFPPWLGLNGALAGGMFLAAFAAAYAVFLRPALGATLDLARGALGRGAAPQGGSPAALERYALVPLVLYLPLCALAFAISNLEIASYQPPIECAAYRYFLPHLLFAVVLVGAASARLARSGGVAGRAAAGLIAGIAIATAPFNLAEVDPTLSHTGLGSHYDGYNVKQAARALLGTRNRVPPEEVERRAEAFSPLFRTRVYTGLGFYTALVRRSEIASGLGLAELLERWPAERRADAARGVGAMLRSAGELAPEPELEPFAVLARWSESGAAHAEQAMEGLALEWDPLLASEVRDHVAATFRLLREAPAAVAPALARGLGLSCGRLLSRRIPSEREVIAALSAVVARNHVERFAEGLGIGLADGREHPELRAADLELVPSEHRGALERAFAERAREVAAVPEARR